MKNVYLSAALLFAFAAGAQAQNGMAGMDMKDMPMDGWIRRPPRRRLWLMQRNDQGHRYRARHSHLGTWTGGGIEMAGDDHGVQSLRAAA